MKTFKEFILEAAATYKDFDFKSPGLIKIIEKLKSVKGYNDEFILTFLNNKKTGEVIYVRNSDTDEKISISGNSPKFSIFKEDKNKKLVYLDGKGLFNGKPEGFKTEDDVVNAIKKWLKI